MSELIDAYAAGPALLHAAAAGLSPEQARAHPVPGTWSVLELACHLADFEPIFADRMKRVVALNKPLIFGADENEFTRRLAYHERDLGEELAVFAATRASLTRVLRTLPPEAFARQAVHAEKGLVTLEQLLTTAVRHLEHHLTFAHAKRAALGV